MSHPAPSSPDEGLVELGGHLYYSIPRVDDMAPFLMSVVSESDCWMFISSNGGLTAGRRDSSSALFRYDPEDRIHNSVGITGPTTALRFIGSGGEALWTPFRGRPSSVSPRNLYKSIVGNALVFEEANPDLGVTFRYRWTSCDRLGFVRTTTVSNRSNRTIRIELLDGLLDVLPHGVDPALYRTRSNLVNAYRRSQIIDPQGLAAFTLEAGVVDRPEPVEVLSASVVWSTAPVEFSRTLDPSAVAAFETGEQREGVDLLLGRPGAYLLEGEIELESEQDISWHIVGDTAKDQSAVVALRRWLETDPDTERVILNSIGEATNSLIELMAPADALQSTGDRIATAHHFANVTYNVERGGVPLTGYQLPRAGFFSFVLDRNRRVAETHEDWILSLPEVIDRSELLGLVKKQDDPHLIRLAREYLPFGFSRRHGDPSRPWNEFSIRLRDEEGRPVLYFQGNWRDIFQNWEALAASFPEFLPSMVSVFVNASTADGFNPYRITSDGIDWEVPDPEDPWANIGYWGDHQIVYLHRLLVTLDRYHPGELERLLEQRLFSYADVPYRIASYLALLNDPKATVAYDPDAAARIASRVERLGADGKLIPGEDGEPLLVTFLEKLIVPVLAKLSLFVPGGGIWMNTQRPEWNDANNALVGYGLSMVTLYQLRAYTAYLRSLIRSSGIETVDISSEVAVLIASVLSTLSEFDAGATLESDIGRKSFMDSVGETYGRYRADVYEHGLSVGVAVSLEQVAELCDEALQHLDATIAHNRRADTLFHSYNLINISSDGRAAGVTHLHEMLEGQTAALQAGVLSAVEKADLLEALYASDLYRGDQDSFMLYPKRDLPAFLDKNIIPDHAVTANPLLSALVAAGDSSIVKVDADGKHRFNAGLTNRDDVDEELDQLCEVDRWRSLVADHRLATLDVYEDVFDHHSYTGRSGSMYAYEGIGSIYWHMVAKLLVAVQESVVEAVDADASPEVIERLVNAYWRVRGGLGFNKTAVEFGAVPTDPYSHTPIHAGAQQPGMTGLVKEELLTRPLELGVHIVNGEITFDPHLLRDKELLDEQTRWTVYSVDGRSSAILLEAGSLGMTVCQVPIVVSIAEDQSWLEVHLEKGIVERIAGLRLGKRLSDEIFGRSGRVRRVDAHIHWAHGSRLIDKTGYVPPPPASQL